MRPLNIVMGTVLIFLLVGTAFALQKSNSVDEIFEQGKKQTYHYLLNDLQLGTLEAEYIGHSTFEGISGYLIREKLNLDFSPFGQEYILKIENSHYIDRNNRYIGDDMNFFVNNQPQKIFLKKDHRELSGYTIRNNQDEDLSLPQREIFSSFDNNMIDQYNLFLAFYDMNIGDTITDTVFIPQTLLMAPVTFSVDAFKWTRYGDLADSAYVCHFAEPTDMTVYFTKGKKLIRLDQGAQNIKIFLYETPLEKTAPQTKAMTIGDFFNRMPIYLVYLFFGAIFSILLARKYYKEPTVFIALILGALIYLVTNLTLFPLQKWYSLNYIIPGIKSGGSFYSLAIVPSILSGLIQEIIKIIPIVIIFLWKKPKQMLSVTLGLMCGIGFAVFEASSMTGASYQSGTISLFSWSVAERITVILFHAATGAALGYGINRGWKHLLIILITVFIFHSFSDYLIVFVQKKAIDVTILVIIKTLIGFLMVLGTYLMLKTARK